LPGQLFAEVQKPWAFALISGLQAGLAACFTPVFTIQEYTPPLRKIFLRFRKDWNNLMDNQVNSELIQALQGIHAELQRMNQNLANIAAKPAARPAAPSAGPGAAPSARPYASSGPRQYASPSRGRTGTTTGGSYNRTPRPAAADGDAATTYGGSSTSEGPRYAKKKSAAAPRPKGKLPSKKGSGYPKKAK
jgi:hypothetical protein